MNSEEIDRREAALYEEKRQLIHQNNQLIDQVAANNIRLTAIRVELMALRYGQRVTVETQKMEGLK